MWISVAREPGPGPSDVAIGYERAWDELNFGLLWDLSGAELRDGLRRDQFIAAKRAAYADAASARRIGADASTVETFVEGHQTALVVTQGRRPTAARCATTCLLDHTRERVDGRRLLAATRQRRRRAADDDRVVTHAPGGGRAAHRRREPADGRPTRRAIVVNGETLAARAGAGARRGVRSGDRGRPERERARLRARGSARRRAAGGAARRRRRASAIRAARSCCWRATCRSSSAPLLRLLVEWPGRATVIPVVDGRLQYACARYGADALDGREARVARGRSRRCGPRRRPPIASSSTEAEWGAVAPRDAFADVDTPADLRRLGLS